MSEREPRWETGTDLVAELLPDEVGRLYVQQYFPPSSKAGVEQMVATIREAMAQRLQQQEWLSSETKAHALAKLRKLKVIVGYPETWQDYTALIIRRHDVVGNVARAQAFRYATQVAKLDQPINQAGLPCSSCSASTLLAWSIPSQTELAFTAAFLQPPLYDPRADAAVNYGAIGVVIGHEISHNFDDQGRKYDEQGALHDWWQAQEETTFTQRAARLVTQFDAYEPVVGAHVNGQLTLGENIADLTGLQISYAAYCASQPQSLSQTLEGFTPAQRFFLGYAQSCRAKMRESALRSQLQTNPHAPFETRILEVRNLAPWYEAFGVMAENKLYLAPKDRISVW